MAREQVPHTISIHGIVTDTPLSTIKYLTTSFIIQAPLDNTDFLLIGNKNNQFFEIAPGNDLSIEGDKLDHGTQSYFDLSNWYVKSKTGQALTCNVLILERF